MESARSFRNFKPEFLLNGKRPLKGGPVFPVGISERNFVFHLHVSRSLYQFQVHSRAPRPTGVYDQMEQLLPIGNSTFAPTKISGFFPKWKAPTIVVVQNLTLRPVFTSVSEQRLDDTL